MPNIHKSYPLLPQKEAEGGHGEKWRENIDIHCRVVQPEVMNNSAGAGREKMTERGRGRGRENTLY